MERIGLEKELDWVGKDWVGKDWIGKDQHLSEGKSHEQARAEMTVSYNVKCRV